MRRSLHCHCSHFVMNPCGGCDGPLLILERVTQPQGIQAAERTQVTSEHALQWGDYLGLSRRAWCKHQWQKEAEPELEGCGTRKTHPAVATVKIEGAMSPGMRRLPEAGKGK